ncbi:MAG: hypothetical protein AAF802_04420 [Planctomycetota bacterium]
MNSTSALPIILVLLCVFGCEQKRPVDVESVDESDVGEAIDDVCVAFLKHFQAIHNSIPVSEGDSVDGVVNALKKGEFDRADFSFGEISRSGNNNEQFSIEAWPKDAVWHYQIFFVELDGKVANVRVGLSQPQLYIAQTFPISKVVDAVNSPEEFLRDCSKTDLDESE